jgi:hypothetical protein
VTPNEGEARQSVIDQLFGRAHETARDTEAAAARSIAPHTEKLRERVLLLLSETPGGLTDDEGGELLNGDRLLFGRRRQELCLQGLVVDSGMRRSTPAGRTAIVRRSA